MEIRDILKELRVKNNLTQDQLAERVKVTRQAVSRWENGETCGMPLSEDSLISREPDGSCNEDYCKWCYADGSFAYKSKDSLLDFLVSHLPNPDKSIADEDRRIQFNSYLLQLKHWK